MSIYNGKSLLIFVFILFLVACGVDQQKVNDIENQINDYNVSLYNNYFENENFILRKVRTVNESKDTVLYFDVQRKVNNAFDDLNLKKKYSVMVDLFDKLNFTNKGVNCGKDFICYLEGLTLSSSEDTYYMKYDEDKQDLEMVINKNQIYKP